GPALHRRVDRPDLSRVRHQPGRVGSGLQQHVRDRDGGVARQGIYRDPESDFGGSVVECVELPGQPHGVTPALHGSSVTWGIHPEDESPGWNITSVTETSASSGMFSTLIRMRIIASRPPLLALTLACSFMTRSTQIQFDSLDSSVLIDDRGLCGEVR